MNNSKIKVPVQDSSAVINCHGYLFTSHASARDLKVPISTITEIMSAGS